MMNYSKTNPVHNATAITNIDLTVLELATYIVSGLIGMAVLGLTVVVILL